MKMKLLVAATMFAVAGQAAAAIAPGSSGNGELFLSVYDSVALTSYTRDLGIDMNTFNASGSNAGYSLSFAGDSLLASAFGSLATNSNLLWNVAALDSTVNPGNSFVGMQFLSTTNASLATVKTQTNTNLAGFATVDGYVNAVNAGATDFVTNNSSTAASADGSSYFGNSFGNNWNKKAVFDSTAAVGSSLNFFALTPSDNSGLHKATVTQFGNADGAATWTLASNGTLSYVSPAPSAVPVPAAVWLLGSGLIGMVGVARRKVK
ncbi:VPLPA-CTERM sorting domain-containing protein [Sulfurirhabdus autotrophica]|uniref:Putative secreted protein n=1 Tax=Sulfurirhabdus autotrophica TaxID=1706046 RepID=A0A4R3YEE4_9PROT|nr:VPLPA-CTERM sorting domain-containing protein [Sulfurirhabdus autotrophica]TCV89528.1 putative secreted protein [Sulfurirhabdus autotrophica]